jgi:hypothetical protein
MQIQYQLIEHRHSVEILCKGQEPQLLVAAELY